MDPLAPLCLQGYMGMPEYIADVGFIGSSLLIFLGLNDFEWIFIIKI